MPEWVLQDEHPCDRYTLLDTASQVLILCISYTATYMALPEVLQLSDRLQPGW
jgi:hypothetical protein